MVATTCFSDRAIVCRDSSPLPVLNSQINMKPFSFLSFLGVALGSLTALAASTVYQCPMHPWIKSDKPGDHCTICNMALVAAPANDSAGANDPNLVRLSPASASVIGVQTIAVRRAVLIRTLRVAGVVDDDDTRHRIIAARVPGRVEKLFVNFVGAEVHEGDPLAVVYSPEMLTAQRQYVERLKAGTSAFTVSERSAAREKLLDLGLIEEEINILEHTLEPTPMVNVRAPMSGTVVARHVYEGQELNKDQSEKETRLFEIADFSSMWFIFDAYEPDLAWLRVGQMVDFNVASQPGKTLTAPITFIDPNLNEMTRTARVRVVLKNHDHALRHKQTGLARVHLEIPDVLITPRSAVLQHGTEPIVFIQQADHSYAGRLVQLGRVGDDFIEIVSGLAAGDRVVTEGALLIDGQAQLARAAITVSPAEPHRLISHSPTPLASISDDPSYAALKRLALATADVGTPLADDNLEGYKKLLPDLQAALTAFLQIEKNSELAKFKTALRAPVELRITRREFEPFSTAVADLARARQLVQRENLHVFQCPMAPILGSARWLSRTADVKNPFFGTAMPECGDELNPAPQP
jgi:Cu(I)/Ag(I) efflux system membrane fusion protein